MRTPEINPAERFAAKAQEWIAPLQARFDALVAVVAAAYWLAPSELTSPAKTRAVMAAKRCAVSLAIEFLTPRPFNHDTLALFFNLGRTTLYRLAADARKLSQENPEFAARLEALRPHVREALKETTHE